MGAWGAKICPTSEGVGDAIVMLADPSGNATREMGMINPQSAKFAGMFGHAVSQRYSMVIKDNVIQTINIDESKVKETLAPVALAQIEGLSS